MLIKNTYRFQRVIKHSFQSAIQSVVRAQWKGV